MSRSFEVVIPIVATKLNRGNTLNTNWPINIISPIFFRQLFISREVSLLGWDPIEQLNTQDRLHEDSHHVEHRESASFNRCVDPCPAIIGAAQKIMCVIHTIGEYLDEQLPQTHEQSVFRVG